MTQMPDDDYNIAMTYTLYVSLHSDATEICAQAAEPCVWLFCTPYQTTFGNYIQKS